MSARLVGATALLGVLLAGCSAEPEPRIASAPTATPSSAAPSATPSPTEVAVPSPEPTSVPTTVANESAEDFVKRWLDLSTEMQRTGRTDSYRSITSECEPCDRLARQVRSYYRDGGYIRFDGQRATSVERIPAPEGLTVLNVVVEAGPTEYRESSSAVAQSISGGTETLEVYLVGSPAQGWFLNNYLRLPQ